MTRMLMGVPNRSDCYRRSCFAVVYVCVDEHIGRLASVEKYFRIARQEQAGSLNAATLRRHQIPCALHSQKHLMKPVKGLCGGQA
jgi:hypothetical protein